MAKFRKKKRKFYFSLHKRIKHFGRFERKKKRVGCAHIFLLFLASCQPQLCYFFFVFFFLLLFFSVGVKSCIQ
jgi:hypothetical protein